VSTSAAAASVIVAIFAAYAVSRYGFRGKRVFTSAVLATQMFPGILFALPLFLIFVSIGDATGIPLYGSRGGLIITYLTFSLPFAIWMLTSYFESVPKALDEAALVDGCGPVRALFRVVIPAALPGIIAAAEGQRPTLRRHYRRAPARGGIGGAGRRPGLSGRPAGPGSGRRAAMIREHSQWIRLKMLPLGPGGPRRGLGRTAARARANRGAGSGGPRGEEAAGTGQWPNLGATGPPTPPDTFARHLL
jgi:hypothetical protein